MQSEVFTDLDKQQILITILSLIEHDQNLVDTFSAAPALGHYGLRGDWQVWQNRFLALYDAPVIEHKDEWMIAYQLRQFVLRRLSYRFEHEDQEHMNVQLQVVKDMVLGEFRTLNAFQHSLMEYQKHTMPSRDRTDTRRLANPRTLTCSAA